MGIIINKQKKTFLLQSKNSSYLMQVVKDKYLAHVYWGEKLPEQLNMENAILLRNLAFSANTELEDRSYSLDYVRQEYPTGCGTDYRNPAIQVVFEDGSRLLDLQYDSYELIYGKPKLEGLPATYVEKENEAQTIYITLRDKIKGLKVVLAYTVYEELDVITRSVNVRNESGEIVCLEKVMSASMDFEDSDYECITLPGAWGRERHIERNKIHSGMQEIGSRRGASSHQLNPFFALVEPNTTEESGRAYGFNFVYSGNFLAGCEVDQIFQTRAYMGINPYDFSWRLEAGESFQAPEAVLVFSANGLGELSRTYHKLYRTRLVRGKYRDAARPILANNWEATYFDFDEEKIVALAKEAAELGIELLVLDDGWFGKREGDYCSLGDWYENKKKLPNGIAALSKKVKEQGVCFGLWFEPEMVSPDSDLYRAHPDWCIHIPNRTRTECRSQLTLDLSRKEVCEYIIDAVSKVLEEADISYVKWDMNRHMTNLGSLGLSKERQKEMPHRYMLGLYYVLETITKKYPDVLFESCSGGGGRFDPGMLYYMPQTWTSDDTDAIERLYIQYGTSLAYPVSAMGAHVSAVPNHQAGRTTNLKIRGDVAMSGNFGYELDLMKFTEEEKEIVKEQVLFYKKLRTFVPFADMYRLKSPFEGNDVAWLFLSEDKTKVFVAYFRILCKVNPGICRLKLPGLEPEAQYQLEGEEVTYSGAELMYIGFPMEVFGDYQSQTFLLHKKS